MALIPAPVAQAIVTSNSAAVNINQFLGAERFYDAGYTGTRTIQANIEAGHVWNGHYTLGHVTTRITGNGALGTDNTHATQVGAALAGRPTSTTYPDDLRGWGIAHGAETWSGAIATSISSGTSFNATNQSVASTYAAIVQTGNQTGGQTADVFNSSWGNDNTSGTHLWTRGIDGLIYGNGTVGVFAAGNGGSGDGGNTVQGPAAGYNSISVAALTFGSSANPYVSAASFSSRGPNDFAMANSASSWTTISKVRAAVDIAAPGNVLRLATDTNANAYASNRAGTSFAAPLVAAGASLLVDAGKDLYAGNSNAVDGRVVKSVLLNAADKTSGWNNGQLDVGGVIRTEQSLDWATGAGRMNLDRAFDQYVSTDNGGLAGTIDVPGLGPADIAPVGWDFGRVDAFGTNTYFIDQPLVAGTNFTTTLSWFADRSTGNLNHFIGAGERHLANLDLSIFQFDDLTNRNILGTVAESVSLYNVVEHLSFLTPTTGFYGIEVSYTDAHWNFSGATGEYYGLAWTSTPVSIETGERFWMNPAGGNFNTPDNWDPVAVPTFEDTAVFDLSGAYTVEFFNDFTNERMLIGNNHVTFALEGHTYTLTSESAAMPSIAVGLEPGDDAQLVISGGALVGVGGVIGQVDGASELVVSTGGVWTSDWLTVGDAGAGTMTVEAGGSVFTNEASLALHAAGGGLATVTGSDAVWHNSGSLFVGGSSTAAGGEGIFEITDGGTVTVDDVLKTWTLGTVSLSGGNLSVATLDLSEGAFQMSGGRLTIGTVVGHLTIAGGRLAFGNSPGEATIAGSYTQQEDATLEIEIGGLLQGSEFDFLSISGPAVLGGALDVLLVDDFLPEFGTTFEIIHAAAGITGTFADLLLPDLFGGLIWNVHYDANSVLLAVALAGDFNGDGVVDMADYVYWRKNGGSLEEYDAWRANFGQIAVSGLGGGQSSAASLAPVPEPSSMLLLTLAAVVALAAPRGWRRT